MQFIGGFMKALLKEIIETSRWKYKAFDGKLIIQGRILSPIESQAVGIGSALIASAMATSKDLEIIQKIDSEKDVDKENADQLFEALKNFDADKILKMAENQDLVLCKCIISGSMDDGKNWQDFKLVMQENQQRASQNRLWVGMLPEKDRKEMIELCLLGHQKAAEKIRGEL